MLWGFLLLLLFLLEKRDSIMIVANGKLQGICMCLGNTTLIHHEIYLFSLISPWLPKLLHITAIPCLLWSKDGWIR